jgi:hypothetical protein
MSHPRPAKMPAKKTNPNTELIVFFILFPPHPPTISLPINTNYLAHARSFFENSIVKEKRPFMSLCALFKGYPFSIAQAKSKVKVKKNLIF